MVDRYTTYSEELLPPDRFLIRRMTNGEGEEPILLGAAVWITGNDFVQRALASFSYSAQFWGIALSAIAVSASGLIAFGGLAVIPSALQVGSWSYNDRIYLDNSSYGKCRNSPPTTAGHFIAPVGRVISISGGDALISIEKGEIMEIG